MRKSKVLSKIRSGGVAWLTNATPLIIEVESHSSLISRDRLSVTPEFPKRDAQVDVSPGVIRIDPVWICSAKDDEARLTKGNDGRASHRSDDHNPSTRRICPSMTVVLR